MGAVGSQVVMFNKKRQTKNPTMLCLCHYVKIIESVMEGACSEEHEVNKQMRNLKAKAVVST